MRGVVWLVSLVLVLVTPAGCARESDTGGAAPTPAAGSGAAAASEVPFPADLVAYIDQSRLERVGRSAFIRLVNAGEATYTVTRAELSSERFAEVTWSGEKSFMNEADLDLELPPGTCGSGSDAQLRLTYRVDEGPEVVSTTTATDRYGAIALFLERDCAAQTLAEAAELSVGRHRITGTGTRSRFVLPVTLQATGARDDVGFTGFQGTVLFKLVDPTPIFPTARPLPLGPGDRRELTVRLIPTRCDPHALAEDKVGTLIGVHVVAPGLAEGAFSYLPLSDDARGDLRGFFTTYCGFGM